MDVLNTMQAATAIEKTGQRLVIELENAAHMIMHEGGSPYDVHFAVSQALAVNAKLRTIARRLRDHAVSHVPCTLMR